MDNKLSELSKPVAYTDAEELRFHHATSDMWPVPLGFGKDVPLYSQEYVSALLARIEELESTEIKPEGVKLMSEAIGAHGYIVGCLVQGRSDLALEESRKWVDAFSQAAELINNG